MKAFTTLLYCLLLVNTSHAMLVASNRGATRVLTSAVGRVNVQRSRLHTGRTGQPDQTGQKNASSGMENIASKSIDPKSPMLPKWNVPHEKQNWRFWQDVQKEREEEERRVRERNKEKEEEREEDNERDEEEGKQEGEKPEFRPFTDKDLQDMINIVNDTLDFKDELDKQEAAKKKRELKERVALLERRQRELRHKMPTHE